MDTGTKNRLAGAWHRMTGRAQMAAGAQFDDPERFFNGVVDDIQGRLQEKLGADQGKRVADALRLRWEGLNQQTKGHILKQWGEWADDPVAMAQGVVDLAQGQLKRYAGATALHASSKVSEGATTLNDQTAEAARNALEDIFARNTTSAPGD
jgi:uncharacterized protein YjbJ (UPF0337 family)